MNTWTPLEEHELLEMINEAWERMNIPQRRLWDGLKVEPNKWQLDPWGNEGNGFWVVGIIGDRVIWYNDIEEGFNTSHWSSHGTIDKYWCNQDQLEWAIGHLQAEIDSNNLTEQTKT